MIAESLSTPPDRRRKMTDLLQGLGDDRYQPGTWRRILAHTPEPEYRPFWTAIICCPECGRYLAATAHTISTDGQITPSLGHPVEYPPCSWHTAPRLIGWEAWPVPAIPDPETCERCGKIAHNIGGWGTWSGGPGLICAQCFAARAAR